MMLSPTDTSILLLLLRKHNRFLTESTLHTWLSMLPTGKRPDGELSATQLESITGYTKAYIRRKLQDAGVKPVLTIQHAGHPQAYYNVTEALAAIGVKAGYEPQCDHNQTNNNPPESSGTSPQ